MDSKKPKKHLFGRQISDIKRQYCFVAYQAANAVSIVKSAIMDLNEMNSMLFDMTLNANRGIRTGAPMASTSSACCPGARDAVRQPCILNTRYVQ